MVKTCPECCSFNNDNAIFCSSCGLQLSVLPVVPTEVTDRMHSLQHSVGELSQSNKDLQEQLQKAIGEIKTLSTKVESSEQAQRLSGERTATLAKANEDLLEQVRQLSTRPHYTVRPRYCDQCGKPLQPTSDPHVAHCPTCHCSWSFAGWPSVPPVLISAAGNCAHCGQPVSMSSNFSVNYCPHCGKYQPHIHR